MRAKTRFAVSLAKKAGNLLLSNLNKIKKVKEKNPMDFVTDSDIAVESMIISSLKKEFPEHDILSEEAGQIGNNSDYKWIIDPLDGTHNFIHRFPLFGVSIALEYKKELILGVINLPTLNQIYFSEKGHGSYLNNKRISVSNIQKLSESMVTMDSAFNKDKDRILSVLSNIADNVFRVHLPGTAVFELTALAQGITTAHISFYTNPWDISAGLLMIKEAGGKITDFHGGGVNHYCKSFVATNRIVHEDILRCVAIQ